MILFWACFNHSQLALNNDVDSMEGHLGVVGSLIGSVPACETASLRFSGACESIGDRLLSLAKQPPSIATAEELSDLLRCTVWLGLSGEKNYSPQAAQQPSAEQKKVSPPPPVPPPASLPTPLSSLRLAWHGSMPTPPRTRCVV